MNTQQYTNGLLSTAFLLVDQGHRRKKTRVLAKKLSDNDDKMFQVSKWLNSWDAYIGVNE